MRKGWSKEKVLAAYTRAMAIRMANLINRVGLEKEFVITGGQSKNMGIVSRVENILGVKTLPSPNPASAARPSPPKTSCTISARFR